MWHAFGSEPDRDSLLQASERWIEAALRGDAIAVRFVVLDARGRLNSVYGSHEGRWGDPGLRRARLAIEAKTPRPGVTRTFRGARILSVPLVTRGSALGAVEIATTSPMRPDRRELVEAVVSQTAVALANLQARALQERGLVSMRSAIELGVEIAGAESREEAIRGLVRGLYRDLQLRSAGWLVDASGVRLVATAGLGSRRRDGMRRAVVAERVDAVPRLTEVFASVLGTDEVEVIEGGGAVVLSESPADPAIAEATTSLRGFASEWLESRSSLEGARRRVEWYGTAIAVTAHELRGPMLAAKATIDGMVEEGGHTQEVMARPRDSRRQLEELTETVDVRLRWSRPEASIRRRGTDLSHLVDAAIDSVVRETGEARVVFEAPLLRVEAPVSRRHVSLAVSNLLRNAIIYSPPGSIVEVGVSVDGGSARISVRDRGPGVDDDDVDAIFQPFVRGRRVDGAPSGSGLGLFIVARVAEAHGGRAWVDRGRTSTTFHLSLPLRAAASNTRKAGSTSTR
jgi:signal transduction histidine kinase